MKKALFLDRDGIINHRIIGDYVKHPSEFHLIPEVLPLFHWAKENNYLTIIITNQQGIGKGLMTESDLNEVHQEMRRQLSLSGIIPDDIFFCSDLDGTNSPRRKPAPGMLLEAIAKWNINPAQSWMIGDSISDVIAGKSAGTKTILIGNYSNISEADFICPHIGECEKILR